MLKTTLALLLAFFSATLSASPVNINTASAEEISAALSGIGMIKAQAIIAYRTKHGSFEAPEQIIEVKGVGQTIFDQNKNDILVK